MGRLRCVAPARRAYAVQIVLLGLTWALTGCAPKSAPRPRGELTAAPAPRAAPTKPTATPATARPAILFATPRGVESIDLDYLRELHGRGFELDITENLLELSDERLRQFNALVLFKTLDAAPAYAGEPHDPERAREFVRVVERFVAAGGGVLLMPSDTNLGRQQLSDLTGRWGAVIAAERIVETDPQRVASLPRASYELPLAFTDRILPSPVSEGVRGIWYPIRHIFLAAATMPLIVDERWTVVVRAAASAVTEPIPLQNSLLAAPGLVQRPQPERSPALFATRELGEGRVALTAQWSQYSIGSGTKLLFGRAVLSRGLREIPSDFGRLLENSYRWLSAPSLASGKLGGAKTDPDRFKARNERDDVKSYFRFALPSYAKSALTKVELPQGQQLYRGLIGARTALTGGRGTVADYARAAQKSGLDYVVFLEDFRRLTPEALRALSAECRRLSDPKLLLLPGFWMRTNLGNKLFFFSAEPTFPPAALLTGPDQRTLAVQQQDAQGNFPGPGSSYADWFFSYAANGQVGYFDFASAPRGVRLPGAHLYGMVALHHYRDGKRSEELQDDYLLTAAGTLPPSPAAVNEVTSPEALAREAKLRRGLTYVIARSLSAESPHGILLNGLRWPSQFDALPVFVSDGPEILAWPGLNRTMTYGGEGFTPEGSLALAPLRVRSDVGLRELRIYDGTELFRRFLPSDAPRDFQHTLVLDGSLQRTLVVWAEDVRGRRAVSAARRIWPEGGLAPVFCGDRTNDCERMLLARGPWSLRLSDPPLVPPSEAGRTWDGGPQANVSAMQAQRTLPILTTAKGALDTERLVSVPLLEFSDQEAVGVSSLRRESYAPELLRVVNPWSTLGPVIHEPAAVQNVQRYRQWAMPSYGPPPSGFAAHAVRKGVSVSLFSDELRYQQPTRVASLQLAVLDRQRAQQLVFRASGGELESVALAQAGGVEKRLMPGDAFALLGVGAVNSHILVNRAAPVRLRVSSHTLDLFAEEPPHDARPGELYRFEMAGHAFLPEAVSSAEQVARYLDYVHAPTGLVVARGERQRSPGLLEVAAHAGAVELSVPRSEERAPRTLPLRITGLNRRWSAGFFQKRGYTAGFYGPSSNRYRGIAVDRDGAAYVPLHIELADYDLTAGHPVIADEAGKSLFIQVTCLGGSPLRWHVSVNNPSASVVETRLQRAMALPGLAFEAETIRLQPGELRVLQ